MIKKIFKERKEKLKNVNIDRNTDSIIINFIKRSGKKYFLEIKSNEERNEFVNLMIDAFKETKKFKHYDIIVVNAQIISLSHRNVKNIIGKTLNFPGFYSEEECIIERMVNGSVYSIYIDQFSLRLNVFKSNENNKEVADEHSFTFTNLFSMQKTFKELIDIFNSEGKYIAQTDFIDIEVNTEIDTLTNCKTIGKTVDEIVNFELIANENGDVFIKENFINTENSIILFEGNINDIEYILNCIEKYKYKLELI